MKTNVYSFVPFGFEGSIIEVETDLRAGIPAYDIIGLADGATKETRERIRFAFSNSGLEFPQQRVLQSLSPADLKKDCSLDLAMAVGVLNTVKEYENLPKSILVLGELELSGKIRPVRGALAAANTSRSSGVEHIICDYTTAELIKHVDGIHILVAETLAEVDEKLKKGDFMASEGFVEIGNAVNFNESLISTMKDQIEEVLKMGIIDSVRAVEIAVAGRHNILVTGAPGCGKTMLQQNLIPALTPLLTDDEAISVSRIRSLAGLDNFQSNNMKYVKPFRMPHQTATIEGICGGGTSCRPGEISLAHNGVLFLDEASEFRTSVLQMLRVPLESKSITLSRVGRSTTYPAHFQLAMAVNPCPCGNFGSSNKICLCSSRSIEQYWKKFSDPLIDRVEIKVNCEQNRGDTRFLTLDYLKQQVKNVYEIERERGVYNGDMTPEQISKFCNLTSESKKYLDGIADTLTPRTLNNVLKVARTIADMQTHYYINISDLKEAVHLCSPVFAKPNKFVWYPTVSNEEETEALNEQENEDNDELESYYKVIFDRFCDDIRSFDSVYTDNGHRIIKAWWSTVDNRLHIKLEDGTDFEMSKDVSLAFIGSCQYFA